MLLVRNKFIIYLIIYFILEDGADFRHAEDLPTLHKLIDVGEDGYAYKASLRNDDRLIEVNLISTFIK